MGFSERAKMLLDVIPTSESNKRLIQAQIHIFEGRRNDAIIALKRAVALDSENLDARYMVVRMHLADLTQGKADREILEIAARLDGTPQAIVDGWKLVNAQNWNALYELEPLLAQSAVTDPWLKDTARLRAQWRTKVSTPLLTQKMGSEAIEILDQAIVAYPSFELYMLRLAATEMIKDPYGMVETASVISKNLDKKLDHWNLAGHRLSRPEVSELTRHTTAISELLANTEFDRVFDHRVMEIKSMYAHLKERLQGFESAL